MGLTFITLLALRALTVSHVFWKWPNYLEVENYKSRGMLVGLYQSEGPLTK